MGQLFDIWAQRSSTVVKDYEDLLHIVQQNRRFEPVSQLEYGDYGLEAVKKCLHKAIKEQKKIALYADYDVDGTMSAVSWIWFLRHLGFERFKHYIPCRFKEGYGVNLEAVKYLIHEWGADVIITMDTGITANEEAAYCRSQGVDFICTDHHKIQVSKMPDCLILNPKLHEHPDYQELCGCGITFVLLRQLGKDLGIADHDQLWWDLLALAGMATICDVVPLNPVNHRLARLGMQALLKSERRILRQLRQAAAMGNEVDETDIGFRLGPRINAVGRLEHADTVIESFVAEDPEPLIQLMGSCNERRKRIQENILKEAREQALQQQDWPILFLGGDWHPGVVGIAASKLVEQFWRPVWLFQIKDGWCKGSARSIAGFDIMQAMEEAASGLWDKFGGHKAAAGFCFAQEHMDAIGHNLCALAQKVRLANPDLWKSRIEYDCFLPDELISWPLLDVLQELKPFGHGFEQPVFCIQGVVSRIDHYRDKKTGQPRHSAVWLGSKHRVMFFNRIVSQQWHDQKVSLLTQIHGQVYQGKKQLNLIGCDWQAL